MEEAERFGVNGVNGTLVVLPDRIIIRRKRAWMAVLGQGLKGTREIAIDQVAETEFKKATAFINGYIRFSIVGGAAAKRGALDAAQDENAVMFSAKQQPYFEKAKELVDVHRQALRNAAPEPDQS
jgi:hypothetical protein